MGAGLIHDFISNILSVPFCPYHFAQYHFVRTILSATIYFVLEPIHVGIVLSQSIISLWGFKFNLALRNWNVFVTYIIYHIIFIEPKLIHSSKHNSRKQKQHKNMKHKEIEMSLGPEIEMSLWPEIEMSLWHVYTPVRTSGPVVTLLFSVCA